MTYAKNNNAQTTLRRRRRRADPMAAYDRLPSELRVWLSQAKLPWSPQSALRLWRKTLLACDGDVGKAKSRLTRIEGQKLNQDCRKVWGDSHPSVMNIASVLSQ